MWLFHPEIAEVRRKYAIIVRFLSMDGAVSMQRRTGKIVQTDAPETFPLSMSEPAMVEMEYTDNNAKHTRRRVRVSGLDYLHPRNGCKLLVFAGDKKGSVVQHSRTIHESVMVKPLSGGKGFSLPKSVVCPVED